MKFLGISIFIMITISSNLILYFTNFCVTAAKLVILGISPFASFISALIEALVAKLVISGILSTVFWMLAWCTSFLTTSSFTTSLSLTKSTG